MNTLKMPQKNRSWGLNQLQVTHKKVPIYSNPTAGQRCHVYILDQYLSKLPPLAKEKGSFYWQPLQTCPTKEGVPWFSATPCGKNWLGRVISDMFSEAGIFEKKN